MSRSGIVLAYASGSAGVVRYLYETNTFASTDVDGVLTTNVYWITTSWDRDLAIRTMPKAGGAIATVWSTRGNCVEGNLSVDDQAVYFTICPGIACNNANPGVWRGPKTGGPAVRVADGVGQFALSDAAIFSTASDQPLLFAARTSFHPVASSQVAGAVMSGPSCWCGSVPLIKDAEEYSSALALVASPRRAACTLKLPRT